MSLKPPVNANRRIIPADRRIAIRGIGIGAFVDDFGHRYPGDKSMQEARRDQQLTPILKAEVHAHPLPKTWRAMADIHSHIEKRAAPAADEFCLRMRRGLKMQPAQGVWRLRERVVILHKMIIKPGLRQGLGIPAFAEKATRIAVANGGKDQDPSQGGFFDVHRIPSIHKRSSDAIKAPTSPSPHLRFGRLMPFLQELAGIN